MNNRLRGIRFTVTLLVLTGSLGCGAENTNVDGGRDGANAAAGASAPPQLLHFGSMSPDNNNVPVDAGAMSSDQNDTNATGFKGKAKDVLFGGGIPFVERDSRDALALHNENDRRFRQGLPPVDKSGNVVEGWDMDKKMTPMNYIRYLRGAPPAE